MSGVPRDDLVVAVVQIQMAVFGELVGCGWEAQEAVYFARRRTVVHRSGRHHGAGGRQVSRSLPETRIPDRTKTHGTAARCRPGWRDGESVSWKARGVLGRVEARCLVAPLGFTTGSSFSDQCSASQMARVCTQRNGRQKQRETSRSDAAGFQSLVISRDLYVHAQGQILLRGR